MRTLSTPHSVAVRTASIALGVFVSDAVSKAAAPALVSLHAGLGFVLPIQNAEYSFGIASASLPLMLAASALGILAFGGYTAWSATHGGLPAWIPGLLIGGGAGNLIDRLLFGAVHDWLDLGKVVVNLADLAILAGLAGYLASVALHRRAESRLERL